jgi:hypothetical protein
MGSLCPPGYLVTGAVLRGTLIVMLSYLQDQLYAILCDMSWSTYTPNTHHVLYRICTIFVIVRLYPINLTAFRYSHITTWLPLGKLNYALTYTGWSKSLCAPDDCSTESYKLCSKCPRPVSRHLLRRRAVFSKTVFSVLTTVSVWLKLFKIVLRVFFFFTVIITCIENFDHAVLL